MPTPELLPFQKVRWAQEFIDRLDRPFRADDWVNGVAGLIDDDNFRELMAWIKKYDPDRDVRSAAVAWVHLWHEHGERIGGEAFDREASLMLYEFVERWLEDNPNDRYSYPLYEEYFLEGRAPSVACEPSSGQL